MYPGALLPGEDTLDYILGGFGFQNRTSLTSQLFHAPVFLPQGAKVKRLTLVGFRDDALATMQLRLQRVTDAFSPEPMATVTADWTIGNSSGYTETIAYPDIDNETYSYMIDVALDPNDAVEDVKFYRAKIDWD